MSTVIGLTGYAASGKSTVANYLVEQHGFTRVSFAAPLKKMLRTLDPIMGYEDFGDEGVVRGSVHPVRLSDLFKYKWTEATIKADDMYGPEYRRLLQVLGTDCIRSVQEDFWVKAAEKQMPDSTANYVFDDCRFPNEADFIKSLNPEGLWHIGRAGIHAANDHPSEQHAGRMGEAHWIENPYNGDPDLRVNPIPISFLYEQIDTALENSLEAAK